MKQQVRQVGGLSRALVFALAIWSTAHAQQPASHSAESAFSFDIYGDSRTMMYLPYRADQEADARKVISQIFTLVMPPSEAALVAEKDVKLVYDSANNNELAEIVMPFMTSTEVMTVKFDKGWATEASVEDVKLLPGVHRIMFRLQGGEWVTREVVQDVRSGKSKFILSTGDFAWWGAQGATPFENPYWQRVMTTLVKQLPPPDQGMRSAGLGGRVVASPGNHEVWEDPKLGGFFGAFPYLKKLGVTDQNLTYKFDYGGARFIFLWTGKFDAHDETGWTATRPTYDEQMTLLRRWLDEAKAAGTKKVFISFHNATFSNSGMGPIPEAQSPHKTIAAYAKDLDIVVVNGHIHSTQQYQVDGVKYLVIGGGGAEQDPILPGRTNNVVPAGYPQELYWHGGPPLEEYNYVHVTLKPGQPTTFTLTRFRPWSAEPFSTVELFK
jgi:hypothetical protein